MVLGFLQAVGSILFFAFHIVVMVARAMGEESVLGISVERYGEVMFPVFAMGLAILYIGLPMVLRFRDAETGQWSLEAFYRRKPVQAGDAAEVALEFLPQTPVRYRQSRISAGFNLGCMGVISLMLVIFLPFIAAVYVSDELGMKDSNAFFVFGGMASVIGVVLILFWGFRSFSRGVVKPDWMEVSKAGLLCSSSPHHFIRWEDVLVVRISEEHEPFRVAFDLTEQSRSFSPDQRASLRMDKRWSGDVGLMMPHLKDDTGMLRQAIVAAVTSAGGQVCSVKN